MSANNYLGRVISNYRIVSEIAGGAFGRVYLAQHTLLTNRTVAIKMLHAAHLNSVEEGRNFLQEAQFLEVLKHPYILPILDVGIDDGVPYLVAEYAPNGSLRDRLKRQPGQPLPPQEALNILTQLGQALYYAHQQHVIHRDIKPENILFNPKGEALLADFGVATMMETASIKYATIIGTPSYMAPEQFQNSVSKESDQYSLGCVAYELFTGQRPFTANDFFAMGFKHMQEAPVPLTLINPQLPPHIEQAVLRAIAKQRSDRFPDVKAFITELHVPTISQGRMPIIPFASAPNPRPSQTSAPTQPTVPDASPGNQQIHKEDEEPTLPGAGRYHETPVPPHQGTGNLTTSMPTNPSNARQKPPVPIATPYVTQGSTLSGTNIATPGQQFPLKSSLGSRKGGSYPPKPPGSSVFWRRLTILTATCLLLAISIIIFLLFATPRASLTSQQIAVITPTTTTALPTATPLATASPTNTPTHGATIPSPQSFHGSETITVKFVDLLGTSTSHTYSGKVNVTLTGHGQAYDNQNSDAFYFYTNSLGEPIKPNHPYCFVLFIDGQPTANFVPLRPYSPAHTYTFTMLAPGGILTFAVCDGNHRDNTGSFTVTVIQD